MVFGKLTLAARDGADNGSADDRTCQNGNGSLAVDWLHRAGRRGTTRAYFVSFDSNSASVDWPSR